MYGRGKILRIDLTSGKVVKEPVSEELARKYIGGAGINDYLLWEHFLKADIKCDPVGPDNVLIGGLGPLGATGYGAGSKMKWTFKSPMTYAYGAGSGGGFFSSNLRWAGYDHIVVTGKAEHPVYIRIHDDLVEIRDARHLWGKDTFEVPEMIREELGDSEVEVACVGIAAENLVRYVPIISRERSGGKTGAGCVMASKNLKAIAVRGTGAISIYDRRAFLEACDELLASLNAHPKATLNLIRYGTHPVTGRYDSMGMSAFRNNLFDVIPKDRLANMHEKVYEDKLKLAQLSCSPGCAIGCGGTCKIEGDESPAAADIPPGIYCRPEYEAMGAFGTMCDIADFPACIYLWYLSDKYDIDIQEMGACISFLMELWERGIITEKDTEEWFGEPLTLEWGNHKSAEKIVHSVALQKNKGGELLKDGVYRTALKLEDIKGIPLLKYAIYGKFGVAHVEDIRARLAWATGFAVASRGCDHLTAYITPDQHLNEDLSMEYFGVPDAADPLTLTLKGASAAFGENRQALSNCLGLCVFVVNRAKPVPLEPQALALYAVTGMKMTPAEMTAAGERTVNLEKAINSRLGYRREDDTLCERWLKEEVRDGIRQGWKAEDYLEQTLDEYYQYHGWDKKTSLQIREKLEQLEMKDVADVLERDGALA